MKIRPLVLTMSLAIGLAGCGGGGAEVQSTVSGSTLGQELADLEQARQQGLVTEEEYEDSREAIMERYEQ